MSLLGSLLDLFEDLHPFLDILNRGQSEGDPSVDGVGLEAVEADLVETDDSLGLAKPADALARGLENVGIAVARRTKNLDHIDVGTVADDLAGLIHAEGALESLLVVHVLDPALDPVVDFRCGPRFLGRGVEAHGVRLDEFLDRTEPAFAVDDLKKETVRSFCDAKSDRVVDALLANGVLQLLHLGGVDSLGLGIAVLVDEPARISVNQLSVDALDALPGKLYDLAARLEKVAVDVFDITPEFPNNFRRRIVRMLGFHGRSLRVYE